ncbi:hypothetical protein [Halarchaeum nitratireducens]|uniref:Uncharacterized protein n=1 Tax=Halarchaeum nitratireducens TaxID=489913 RepID=A0A830G7X1_9EURY|nr:MULTISPECIES: hypothetical protein [Halarchaeum]MBP2249957.1 hypothetical protein [Halarchaeum solikamskense]GGN09537.1 hypothetical protein GCM10009021_06360 [Halarchaeum nitratireducens]
MTDGERAGRRYDRDVTAARDGSTRRADAESGDSPGGDPGLGGDAARVGPTARPAELTAEEHDAYYLTDPGDTEVH